MTVPANHIEIWEIGVLIHPGNTVAKWAARDLAVVDNLLVRDLVVIAHIILPSLIIRVVYRTSCLWYKSIRRLVAAHHHAIAGECKPDTRLCFPDGPH